MTRIFARLACFAAAATMVCGFAASPSATAADDAQGTQIDVFDKAQLTVPEEWKRVEVRSSIIEHEFSVAAKQDPQQTARITMMPAGGSIDDNIERWKGQFAGGKPDAQKVQKTQVGDYTVHLVDVAGTFTERMGGGPFAGGKVVQRPDYAMIGAIIVTPERRQYFVKMTGPEKVVQENREAFTKMVKEIREKK